MTATTEAEFLASYSPRDYASPLLTVDVAIFTLHEDSLKLLLVKRDALPQKDRWALPGGFVDLETDLDLDACAHRKLVAKTGVKSPWLEQVASVGNAERDPRGWSVTVLYMALIAHAPSEAHVTARDDVAWFGLDELGAMNLAFDHADLVAQARDRLKQKTAYTVLPLHVLAPPFTLTQLQRAFETLLEAQLEKKSFRRRVLNAEILDEVGAGRPASGRGRPAALYVPRKASGSHLFTRILGEGS